MGTKRPKTVNAKARRKPVSLILPLSVLEREFLSNYLSGPPGVRGSAYRALVLTTNEEPSDKLKQRAARILGKSSVKREILRWMAKHEIATDKVLEEVRRLAFSDLREVAVWGPNGVEIRPSSEISAEGAGAIASISESSRTTTRETSAGPSEVVDRVVKVKLHDKLGALTLLSKHLGIVRDRKEVTGIDGGPIEVTGPGGGPIPVVDLATLATADLVELRRVLASAAERAAKARAIEAEVVE